MSIINFNKKTFHVKNFWNYSDFLLELDYLKLNCLNVYYFNENNFIHSLLELNFIAGKVSKKKNYKNVLLMSYFMKIYD